MFLLDTRRFSLRTLRTFRYPLVFYTHRFLRQTRILPLRSVLLRKQLTVKTYFHKKNCVTSYEKKKIKNHQHARARVSIATSCYAGSTIVAGTDGKTTHRPSTKKRRRDSAGLGGLGFMTACRVQTPVGISENRLTLERERGGDVVTRSRVGLLVVLSPSVIVVIVIVLLLLLFIFFRDEIRPVVSPPPPNRIPSPPCSGPSTGTRTPTADSSVTRQALGAKTGTAGTRPSPAVAAGTTTRNVEVAGPPVFSRLFGSSVSREFARR